MKKKSKARAATNLIYMPGLCVGMRIPAYTIPGNEDQTLILWEKAGIGDAF